MKWKYRFFLKLYYIFVAESQVNTMEIPYIGFKLIQFFIYVLTCFSPENLANHKACIRPLLEYNSQDG